MIKQPKDYIKSKKKQHLTKAIIWGSVVFIIFTLGLVLFSKRANECTLVAALFVLPFSLNLTRYFAYAKFKDPSPKRAAILERMKGTYSLFHSSIFPETTGTFYFEHIVITSRAIYFLTKNEEMLQKAKQILPLRFKSKGYEASQLKFIHVPDATAVKNASLKIQKDACFSDEQLVHTTKIVEAMLM